MGSMPLWLHPCSQTWTFRMTQSAYIPPHHNAIALLSPFFCISLSFPCTPSASFTTFLEAAMSLQLHRVDFSVASISTRPTSMCPLKHAGALAPGSAEVKRRLTTILPPPCFAWSFLSLWMLFLCLTLSGKQDGVSIGCCALDATLHRVWPGARLPGALTANTLRTQGNVL